MSGIEWGAATVRVTGIRRSRFVEFEFALDPELSVELVMPHPEFQRFCDEHHVRMLSGEEEAVLALHALAGDATDPPPRPAPSRDLPATSSPRHVISEREPS